MYVIGTAGHIDHGKSALIQRLTGIDPDRLREEKERGMTIDLGFAWLKLPSGNEVGIIDVPGHEKFIKNMLAGVSAIDLALLVIAANEGIMPQTREHLAILDLQGIKKGIVVITKKDLVDDEMLSLVRLEIDDLIKDTFLNEAPVLDVSSVTGDGLDSLARAIDEALKQTEPRKDLGRPRLFIDRVFTISGAGTVITGTLIDGSLQVAQEVEILPKKIKARIRGLQTHKTTVQNIGPGSRVAVNLANIQPSQIERGNVLTKPGWLQPTKKIDARFQTLKDLHRPVKHGATVSLFTGSSEVIAKIHLLDNEEVLPGDQSWIQLTLEEPVAAVKGDHYIIRSPMDTLGGGVIIDPHARSHKRFRAEIIGKLADMEKPDVGNVIMAFVEVKQPVDFETVVVKCNLSQEDAKKAVNGLIADKKIIAIARGNNSFLFSSQGWTRLTKKTEEIVGSYHKQYPARSGMPKSELANKLGMETSSPVFQKLVDDKVIIEEGTVVRHPSHRVAFSSEQKKEIDMFLAALEHNPYSPQVDIMPQQDIVNQLIEQQNIVRVGDGVIFSKKAYDEMASRVIEVARKNGKITLAEVRDMFDTSRKYAKALLEFMDDKKLTRRVGDDHLPR